MQLTKLFFFFFAAASPSIQKPIASTIYQKPELPVLLGLKVQRNRIQCSNYYVRERLKCRVTDVILSFMVMHRTVYRMLLFLEPQPVSPLPWPLQLPQKETGERLRKCK